MGMRAGPEDPDPETSIPGEGNKGTTTMLSKITNDYTGKWRWAPFKKL